MADTVAASNPQEILDLLFDANEGVLTESNVHTAVTTSSKVEMPILDWGSLENYSDDFLSLLSENDLLNGIAPSTLPGTDSLLTVSTGDEFAEIPNHHDHRYCRSPPQSDSGLSDGPVSPNLTDPSSPLSSDSGALSDAGNTLCGVEDLSLADFDFGSLDPGSLLPEDDILKCITDDSAIDVDMDTSSYTDTNFDDDFLKSSHKSEGLPFTMKDINGTAGLKYPELRLSDEEKSLLAREGVVLPENMPLTKEEERTLKAVRRKIRNKISAKESRKRKQGYVEGLEKRVKVCTAQNLQLQKKVQSLEKQNINLVQNLKKLQSLFSISSNKTAQTGTCVMVLLLSFALLIAPNLNPFSGGSPELPPQSKVTPAPGRSRNILQDVDDTNYASRDDFPPSHQQYSVNPPLSIPEDIEEHIELKQDEVVEVIDVIDPVIAEEKHNTTEKAAEDKLRLEEKVFAEENILQDSNHEQEL